MARETAPAHTVKFPGWVNQALISTADTIMAYWPQAQPSPRQLQHCQIIGHRGCKDIPGIKENSLAAFDTALAAGADGIELDIRWTADQQLVVAHDPDLARVHGLNTTIANITFNELRKLCPAVPLLAEVLERYAGKTRFFIELKKDGWNQLAQQQTILLELLQPIQAVRDYYIMSFDLDLLASMDSFSADAKVGITHSNPSEICQHVEAGHIKNVGAHYLVLTRKLRNYLKRRHIALAVGFPASKNSYYREVQNGADFVFVDNPKRTSRWRQAAMP